MQHDLNTTPKHPENPEQSPQHSRRKFLTRATAGVVIASLPAKSVWASTGGIAQSIVASGHGSDFAGGRRIEVKSPGYFKNTAQHSFVIEAMGGLPYQNVMFSDVFGNKPIKATGSHCKNDKNLLDVLSSTGKDEYSGPSNVNHFLVSIYLSSVMDKMGTLNYPAWKQFNTPEALAKHIYNKAFLDADSWGENLSKVIDCFDKGIIGACTYLNVNIR